ncbi:MAG: hypothetical protein IJ728_00240 [Selenomonadaceae bacterium]|nr:hypothetical protein [Selenomonadaceae bacterium]
MSTISKQEEDRMREITRKKNQQQAETLSRTTENNSSTKAENGRNVSGMQGFHFLLKADNKDFTAYVVRATWSGNLSEAGRKLEFEIVYTKKDDKFTNIQIDVGARIQMKYQDAGGSEFLLFEGNIFFRDRDSSTYTMSFIAYDNLIYLAKSEMQAKFSNMTASAIIQQVCSTLGVTVGTLHSDLDKTCDFVADPMTGTEIINRALNVVKTWTGWRYKMVMVDNGGGQQVLNVVRADEVIEEFQITDKTNLLTAKHGESIEDMVNQVQIVNDQGDATGYIKLSDEISKYGLLQKVYKFDSKQNTEQAAKLLLQKKKEHSSLSALGSIQCISGYAIEVQEEQIKGKFMIMSDSHRIENNQHYMDLTLDYIVEQDSREGATTEGNVNPSPTTTPKGGKARKTSKAGLTEGIQAFKGQSYTPDPRNGCCWAATGISSYYSQFGAQEYDNGVVYVPTLVADAKAAGLYQNAGEATIEPGDMLIYGDMQHVVVATGGSRYAGNSTSRGKVVEGNDFTNMSGMYVTGVIKTSRG